MRALEQRVELLQEDLQRLNPEATLASSSAAMQHAVDLARQVAPSEAIVLMRGESGTGKTVLARAIHDWSGRSNRPFVVVSCPTLAPELLESELFGHVKGAFTGAVRDFAGRISSAEGGTLFLDEVGDLPLSLQPKLLRFLQDRQYERVGENITRSADVRLIAATNMDLEKAIQERHFREDLFYRLNVFQIHLPPLRDRLEDLEILTKTILDFFARSNRKVLHGFSKEAFDLLRRYSWPGNLRELRNVIERAVIVSRSDWLQPADLPENLASGKSEPRPGDPVSLAAMEELHIRRILSQTKSLQEAADILGIDQATLWRKRKTYGI
jgi:NtrC-family two-component system response regulator AlgB